MIIKINFEQNSIPPDNVPAGSKTSPSIVTVLVLTCGSKATCNRNNLYSS